MNKKHQQALEVVASVLDHWLPHKIQYDELPALSVAISYKGKILYSKGFGYADVEKKVEATPATKYRVASMSKMFTAIALMQLQEKKKLNINDRVSKYVPWFNAKSKVGDLSKITIRQLLSHTSGLIRDGHGDQWETDHFPKLLKEDVGSNSIIYKNPAKFKYSNHGYAILGEVIQAVSGLPYNSYVQKFVIDPLGLKNTSPDFTGEKNNLAKGYTRKMSTKEMQSFEHVSTHAYSPATGFISTAEDIAKVLDFLNSKKSNRTLSAKSKQLMRSRTPAGEKDEAYGLGLQMNRVSKRWVMGHSGGFAGFISEAAFHPESELTVVVLSNRLGANPHSIAMSTFGFFFRVMGKSTNAQKVKNPSRYEGVYRGRWGDTVVIAFPNHLIRFSVAANRPDMSPSVLIEKSSDTFVIKEDNRYASVGEEALFSEIKDGKAQVFSVSGAPLHRV